MADKNKVRAGAAPKKAEKPASEKSAKDTKKKASAPKAEAPKKEAKPKAAKAEKPKKEAPVTPPPADETPDVLTLDADVAATVEADKEAAKAAKKSKITDKSELEARQAERKAEREKAKQEREAKKAEEAEAKKAEREREKAEKKAKREEEKRKEREAREAKKNDPMAKVEARRQRAGGVYLMACEFCGSEDVNANRSPYVAEVTEFNEDGTPKPVYTDTLKDYRCRACNKYTRTVSSTARPIPTDAKVKTVRFETTRSNYHRAKGHATDVALELAGVDESSVNTDAVADVTSRLSLDGDHNTGEIAKLFALAQKAATGDEKAREVLMQGITLKFDFPKPEPVVEAKAEVSSEAPAKAEA